MDKTPFFSLLCLCIFVPQGSVPQIVHHSDCDTLCPAVVGIIMLLMVLAYCWSDSVV